jgi:two-component system cell cycle response regulator CtrA
MDVGFAVKATGASVDWAVTGEEAVGMVRRNAYDIVLVNMVDDADGYAAVRQIRAFGLEIPMLMLSCMCGPEAKVKAFGLGADDCMARPFEVPELLARIQAVVRRNRLSQQSVLRVGALEVNIDARQATVAGKEVPLTGKEYACLELLAVRKGMALTKEAFLAHLYGGMDEPDDKIIDVFICKLRKKLAQAGASSLIATIWGRGYTLREPGNATERGTVGVAEVRALAELTA